ncbi:hypothetical protein LAG90_11200 [Marinilongibacter aquaticus]|uniref:hypothetical protein n=1 Tax=Marinilongibacter aquaticus TaxID=2975157 RepID=UPI0021BD0055|nr:hypothetical protein [Marinilongibacter aquaticus]UBM57385.1 hypothetical protein LAG90_11200 [Marinilongibacter aquaticus]
MKFSAILFISLLLSITSCTTARFHKFGNVEIPRSEELKGFAFARASLSDDKSDWSSTEKAIYKTMRRKNYYFDSQNPDVVVFVQSYPKGVKMLSGNTYKAQNGKEYLEPGYVKTKRETLLIQLVETKKHQTFWRGFAFAHSARLMPNLQPIMANAIVNQ